MGKAILSMLSILVLASRSEKPCTLSESGPSPYLIRIFDTGENPVTYGHGSLIRENKVLSTCTPFKELPKDLVNGKWRLSGYNFLEKCEQRRHPLEIEIHDACKKPDPNMFGTISLDLAVWTVEPFTVEGSPFLWGSGKHLPPPLSTVKSVVRSLVEKKMDCHVALFENAKPESVELQPNASVEFIDHSECMEMIKNITSTVGTKDVKNIFCVYDKGIKWIDSKNTSRPCDTDWYSGAAIVPEGNASNNSIPIGLISRAVTVTKSHPDEKNFRIILGFHNGVYDFLGKSGIETQQELRSRATTNHGGVTQPVCELTESGPHPYLIRISEIRKTVSVTYGHGSLIKENKVLSTCTPYRGNGLKKTDWKLTGYNFEKHCKQQREPTEIFMHDTCYKPSVPSSNAPITHDFAIWTVDAFAMTGMPYLWGNGKPQPPPLTAVKSVVDSLLKFQKALTVGLFSRGDPDGAELQSGTKVNFIDWFVCLDMLKNITNATGDMTDGLNSSTSRIEGFYDYFCGYDVGVKWVTSRISNPVSADWYSGAAVMYEYASGIKVPIGLLSRGVTVSPVKSDIKNFRIIMGFHKGFFEFLSDNGIQPSLLESEFKSEFPTTITWRQARPSGPHIRKSRDQNNHQSGLTSRWGQWISHLTLLGCILCIR